MTSEPCSQLDSPNYCYDGACGGYCCDGACGGTVVTAHAGAIVVMAHAAAIVVTAHAAAVSYSRAAIFMPELLFMTASIQVEK